MFEDNEEKQFTTKHLPGLLKNLDTLLLDQQAKIPVTQYMQIALQLKICQLLNEIKYELMKTKTSTWTKDTGTKEAT